MDARQEPETFDIMKMARQVERKTQRQRAVRLFVAAGLAYVGVRRGHVLGALVAGVGIDLGVRTLTGRSLWEHAQHGMRAGERRLRFMACDKSFGGGTRDKVDEASWESFPASDPPAHSVHGR